MSSGTAAPPAETTAALLAHTLYRFFRAGEEETLALRGVSLSLEPGELVAVTGPSGSGKSTLLSCLAGIDEPDGGTVLVAGQRISHRPEPVRARLRARHIGLLFQSANLFEHLTIRRNLGLAQRLAGRSGSPGIGALLDSVGLTRRGDAYPGELSGGESARAGLALALANDPAVLLADEPTGEIDSATENQILDLLLGRARDGVAILLASHSPAVSAAADRVIRLSDGKVLS
jgi:putative ABC transport system ATP-binding protein